MDTKNTILGIFFIAAGMIILFVQSKTMEEAQQLSGMAEVQNENKIEGEVFSEGNSEIATNDFTEVFEVADADSGFSDEMGSAVQEASTTFSISNEFIEVKLTNAGAAIQEIRFLKAKRGEPDSFVFNQHGQVPSLALSFENNGRLKLLLSLIHI